MSLIQHWQNKIDSHRALFNFVWFKAFWFVAIIYQQEAILLGLLVLYFATLSQLTTHLSHYLLFAVIGISIDYILYQQQIFVFDKPGFPLWLALLWLAFATTIKAFLSFLQTRLVLAALLGMCAGPISYYFAMQLNAVSFSQPLTYTLTILAIAWAVLLPLLLVLNRLLSTSASKKKSYSLDKLSEEK